MNKLVSFVKRHKTSTTLFGVGLVLLGWWVYTNFMPHPLGEKMEYLGQRDYGCWVGFCDSEPGTTYFYATDMTPREVASYFSQTSILDDGTYIDPAPNSGQEPGSYNISFSLVSNKNSLQKINIYYISDAQQYADEFKYTVPHKKHIVEIDARYYNIAKSNL
jgi:hypothetical protein